MHLGSEIDGGPLRVFHLTIMTLRRHNVKTLIGHLTMSLSGRTPPFNRRRERTIVPSARGAPEDADHGRSKRWLDDAISL